ALARKRGVSLRTEQADLFTWHWPTDAYDVVISIFAHFPPQERARMHRAMLTALRPGGLLILEAFTPKQLDYKTGGPQSAALLYTTAMLRQDFAGAEIIEIAELDTALDEGPYHAGRAAVIRLLLRRA
ncbi:MAG: class I SAM-dependent methyltransferase, partial [Myxococcota bacterium]